jgi:hypothetical protein
MLKIFIHPIVRNHALFLELNPKFEFVENSNEADILFMFMKVPVDELKDMVKPHHVIVIPIIFHVDHHMSLEWARKHEFSEISTITNKIILLHTNMGLNDGHDSIYYDHIFDRQKLYCTDYDRGIDLDTRVWTYSCNKEMFSLHEIKKTRFKKFLAPMRYYQHNGMPTHPRMIYRKEIKNFLQKKTDSYISDNNASASFLPNAATPHVMHNVCNILGGSWFPISPIYYNTSLINVYTETLVHYMNEHNVRMVTEKTFDPLIQGNFILPFGYPGLIKDILSYGFKLPNWIDYSYDDIGDNDVRFYAYMESLKKLDNLSLEYLFELATNDIPILEHNRAIFYSRPYDYPLLADKIKLCIENNEANNWKYNQLSVSKTDLIY